MATMLVTGATANLGGRVVKLLGQRGHQVRALSRQPGAGRVVGDLLTGAGLAEAMDGVDTVIHCASDPRSKGADIQHMRTLAAATPATLVYISIVGVDRVPLGYYQAKLAAEQVLAQRGGAYSILRATQFHDLILSLAVRASRLPVVPALSHTRFQPVDAGEVAARLVAIAEGEPTGRVDEFGGPQIRPHTDLVRAFLRHTGKRRLVLPVRVPGGIGRGYRSGGVLTPEHADGTITFDEFLGRSVPAP